MIKSRNCSWRIKIEGRKKLEQKKIDDIIEPKPILNAAFTIKNALDRKKSTILSKILEKRNEYESFPIGSKNIFNYFSKPNIFKIIVF